MINLIFVGLFLLLALGVIQLVATIALEALVLRLFKWAGILKCLFTSGVMNIISAVICITIFVASLLSQPSLQDTSNEDIYVRNIWIFWIVTFWFVSALIDSLIILAMDSRANTTVTKSSRRFQRFVIYSLVLNTLSLFAFFVPPLFW